MSNQKIRSEAKKNGVRLWQICEILEISEATMTRKLRHELPAEEKEKILSIIEKLAKEAAQ